MCFIASTDFDFSHMLCSESNMPNNILPLGTGHPIYSCMFTIKIYISNMIPWKHLLMPTTHKRTYAASAWFFSSLLPIYLPWYLFHKHCVTALISPESYYIRWNWFEVPRAIPLFLYFEPNLTQQVCVHTHTHKHMHVHVCNKLLLPKAHKVSMMYLLFPKVHFKPPFLK